MRNFVSVIIPTRTLSYFLIFENLPALAQQTYKNFEVIVLPNEQVLYDLTLLKNYPWLKIIPTGKITRPAQKRDLGVAKANGDIIAFIDDDAYPDPHWLVKAVNLFRLTGVASVAGPGILPKNAEYWEKAFDEALKTWIGTGGYAYRFIKQLPRYVDDYPSMNLLIKKNLFTELGGFNNNYWPGEDSKLCNDLVHTLHQKILYHPSVTIYHHRRNTLSGFLKQHANYGFHRGAFFAQGDQNSRRFAYLIPTVFIMYLLIAFLSSLLYIFKIATLPILLIILFPLVTYSVVGLVLILQALYNTNSIRIAVGAFIVLILTHITYGLMFVKGYIKGKMNKNNIYG